eukprot:TRINITY_DN7616_c0_g1_i8.p3 TRINITY_DN7616_c0_g1~~TRINITY_DN7616_c0_g1_i8.p3  ORF type:complete len:109 (+),score=27.88 TRINITY_DN7616_c0_g1_i8:100-426(+)
MIRRPPRSTLSSSSAASDVYKRQVSTQSTWEQTVNQLIKSFQGQIKLLYDMSEKQMTTVKNELCISKDLDNTRLLYLINKTKNIKQILSCQILKKKICKDKKAIVKNL